MSYSLEFSAVCSTGNVRKENQDRIFIEGCRKEWFVQQDISIYDTITFDDTIRLAVFDGMGGEECGEIASAIALMAFSEFSESSETALEKICIEINEKICTYMEEHDIYRMGATAALVIVGEKLSICNIGDSRIYRIRDSVIEQLSVDHTTVIGKYNKRKYLSQHLGIPETEMIIEPFITELEYDEKDIYIVCSDGLTDMVSDERILVISSENEIGILAQKLYAEAMQSGGNDNTSVIAFRVKEKEE